MEGEELPARAPRCSGDGGRCAGHLRGATEPEPELVEPPSLDLIDKDFDLASWLKQNVPEAWKLAAMRRAWENDPAIAGFENPARDYALDWNTPGGAPGYGPLTESDDIAEMVRGIFGEPARHPAARLTLASEEATGDGMSHPLSSKDGEGDSDAAVREDAPAEAEPVALRLSESPADPSNRHQDWPSAQLEPDAATQQNEFREPVSVRVRKRGGGAIPI